MIREPLESQIRSHTDRADGARRRDAADLTSSSGRATGSILSSTCRTTLNRAVLTPIASPSVRTASPRRPARGGRRAARIGYRSAHPRAISIAGSRGPLRRSAFVPRIPTVCAVPFCVGEARRHVRSDLLVDMELELLVN